MTDLSGLADSDLQALAAGDMSKVSAAGLAHLSGGDAAPEAPKRGLLSYATGALDELGGGVRTLASHAASNIPGLENIHQEGDYDRALHGQAPTSDELLDRAGVGKMGHLSDLIGGYAEPGMGGLLHPEKGGMLDPSTRGTLGLALDIATDPLTYLTGGLSAAGKASKAAKIADVAAHPVEAAMTHGGEAMYRSAFTRPDAVSAKFFKTPVSDVLWEHGAPSGTARTVAQKAESIADDLGKTKSDLISRAETAGGKADLNEGLEPAQDMLAQLHKVANPDMEDFAKALEERIGSFQNKAARPEQVIPREVATGLVTEKGAPIMRQDLEKIAGQEAPSLSQLDKWKSDAYQALPNSSWDKFKTTPMGSRADQAFGSGFKTAVEQGVDKALPAEAGRLAKTNSDWGSLLTGAGALDKDALRGETKHFLTSVDPLAFDLGSASGGTEGGWKTLILKKLADLSKTTALRTTLGKGINRVGATGVVPAAIQREMVNSQSPWAQMQQEQK